MPAVVLIVVLSEYGHAVAQMVLATGEEMVEVFRPVLISASTQRFECSKGLFYVAGAIPAA